MEKPVLASKPNYRSLVFILLGLTGSFFVSRMFAKTAFEGTYVNVINLTAAIIFAIPIPMFIYVIINLERFWIYKDRFIVTSLGSKADLVVYFSEIKEWEEKEIETRHLSWRRLHLYTDKRNYSFSEQEFANYKMLREMLTAERPQRIAVVTKEKDSTEETKEYWLESCALIGLLFLVLIYLDFQEYNNPPEKPELAAVTGINRSKIEILNGDRKSAKICISLYGQDEFKFIINEDRLKATETGSYLSNAKSGDSITLYIAKDEYLKKITKETPLSFWNKHGGDYNIIPVIGMRDKEHVYLDKDHFYGKTKAELLSGIMKYSVGAIILFSIAIFLYATKARKTSNGYDSATIDEKETQPPLI